EIIEIDDELSSSTISSPIVVKKSSSNSNKRYSSKFKKEWLSIPLFSSFFTEVGLGDIHRHTETNKHKQSTKAAEANRTKSLDATFGITTTEFNRLTAVEGAMVFHSVKHSHSYIYQGCTMDMIKHCFSDSHVGKNISCSRTKAREIACNVLAPSLTDEIVRELRDVSSFSICYDASNKGNVKMLPIAVQFFSRFGIRCGILDFIEQSEESADAVFKNIKYVLEAHQLKVEQLASLGSDNTNVNVGEYHSIFSLFEELSPTLVKGTCYSHVLHNSVKHGNKHLLFDVETTLLKIYSHFCRSSVRVRELKNYFDFVEQEQKIRWLSLLPSIERLIAVHPIVKSYFLNLEDECSDLLLKFFTSRESECALHFLANILPEIQNVNLLLQQEYTTGVNLHGIISNLLRKLKSRLNDEFFGCKVSQLMEDYPIQEIEKLHSSFKCFIRTVIEYIEKYFHKYKLFYQSISIFAELEIDKIEWKRVQQCCTFVVNQIIDFDHLYDEFNHIKSKYIDLKDKSGGIGNQVQSFITSNLGSSKYVNSTINHVTELCGDCEVEDNLDPTEEQEDDDGFDDRQQDSNIYKRKKTTNGIRTDHLWAYLLNGERTPNLRKLIEFVFSIPASNAYCESIFSHMKYL
ncbi:unnamed protein product, partial [Adineta ricciae]